MVEIKVAILDDEEKDLKTVREFFNSISTSTIQYICDEYTQISDSFYNNYDLYILDIELPSINGFEVAQKVKEKCPESVLIIHSKRNDLVFESFKFGVFFFIRKDHFKTDMNFCQLRLYDHFMNIKKSYFSIQNTMNILHRDIMYIEKVDHNIEFHLNNGQIIKEKKSIKQILNEIQSPSFIQCHQSIIVNLSYVNRIENNDFLIQNQRIQISRRYYMSSKQAYIEYLGKKVQI